MLSAKSQSLIPERSKIVELSKNYGQVSAILAGLEVSSGDCSICYSADLQDPPELLFELFRSFLKHNEIVIAVRSSREDSMFQNLTSKIGYWILRVKSPEIPKGGFDFFPAFIKYKRLKRAKGKSAYTFQKRLNIFIDAIFDSTDLLIKSATRIGFFIACCGLISAFFLLTEYLKGNSLNNGFTAIVTSILILGGCQLMMLGIVGEYVYRVYDITRNRPRYIIKNIF